MHKKQMFIRFIRYFYMAHRISEDIAVHCKCVIGLIREVFLFDENLY